jgi:hypothetical protein
MLAVIDVDKNSTIENFLVESGSQTGDAGPANYEKSNHRPDSRMRIKTTMFAEKGPQQHSKSKMNISWLCDTTRAMIEPFEPES